MKRDKPGEERGPSGCWKKSEGWHAMVGWLGYWGVFSIPLFSLTLYSLFCHDRSLGINLPSTSKAYLKMFPFPYVWILRHG